MKKVYVSLLLIGIALVILAWVWSGHGLREVDIEDYTAVARGADIKPDYTGIVVPPNIAALNFTVLEAGEGCLVKIHSTNGEAIEVFSRTGKIQFPERRWKSLLQANQGEELFLDIYVKAKDGRWSRYEKISNRIAKENIDSHIVYRLIKPIYNYWRNISIYQRDLESYQESIVLDGGTFDAGSLYGQEEKSGCVNCHSFLNNDPDKMFIGIRSSAFGSSAILADGGKAYKIGTKFGYTAWHPSGRLAVYSINKVRQFFHSSGMEVRDVVDLDSTLAYYMIEKRVAKTNPAISDKQRLETYPTWSPDGKYLYFCSAPLLWTDKNTVPPDRYAEVKYDLMRIGYDVETDEWGELETLISAGDTGLSVMLPRVSPDGKYMVFCMCNYGCFPIYQPSSDLYIMEMGTGEYKKLDINSELSESWHSWSSNSRWMAFSSKRGGGMFTRTYFSYVDRGGKVYKPFVMGQKDPTFYDSFVKTYSVPELVTGPVTIGQRKLVQAISGKDEIAVDMPVTSATVKTSEGQDYDSYEG